MPSQCREQQLLDAMWERVRPLLPTRRPNPKGGRPWVDDKACFAGIVYQLRNACRWNHLPAYFPSGVTCWRRHRDWTAAGVWADVHRVVVGELAAAGRLDLRELFLDAPFAEDRQGGRASVAPGAASA
ncbi:transposase [Limnoglobus roseus]|uniref:IS5 family transposase n=1 Tax=Limnoglobus roseus TaxID=2598579 RepID=A0A5C1AFZ3_9BACT|nr:transposase [Limnoglobus roseus]QEL17740.1 IS5 family transposase [Limnoglobus roseus]